MIRSPMWCAFPIRITAAGVLRPWAWPPMSAAMPYSMPRDIPPIRIRSALVPVVNIGSNASMPLILLGVVLSWNQLLIQLGIIAFALTVVFQLATLPVEFNASGRALERLEHYGIVTAQENRGCRKVLGAAAMTYVAGTLAAVLQLLRLILLFGGGRRRDD